MRKILIIIFALCFPSISHGGNWVDDWVDQKVSTGPTTIETQKRGYATAGSISYRFNRSRDYLVSVAPPKFDQGCGGTDLFLGSFSFLQFERLVEKFKNIMSAGLGTFAFDIALNVLCEPCVKEIKSLEAIIDRLNALQLDDCKASQTLTAVLKSGTKGDGAAATESATEFLQDTGMEDLYYSVVENGKGKSVDGAIADSGASKPAMVAGCPAEIINIFFTEGAILGNLGNEYGVEPDHLKLMRGLIGDIFVSADLNYNFIPPCNENNPDEIDDMIYGEVYTRDANSLACVKMGQIHVGSGTYNNLYEYSLEMIKILAESMLNKSTIPVDVESFLETVSEPVFMAIKSEIQASGHDADAENIASLYADFAATGYAYSIVKSLYHTITNMIAAVEVAVSNEKGAAPGQEQSRCKMDLKDDAYSRLLMMKESILKGKIGIGNSYTAKQIGFNTRMNIAAQTNNRKRIFIKEMSRKIKR
ncbi:MAG: hypothetical protein GY757_53025 [bacterium]|nr:hypothetical protein [bacterium]